MNGPYSLAEHSVEDVDYTGPGPYPHLPPEERAKKVVDGLDLEQVIEYIGGYKGIAFRGLQAEGIPSVWFTDATNGPRVYGPCTAMPSGLNLAATWNPELASGYGRTVGEETRAYGAYVILGPGVNIYRNPTGGRNFEYMGEDPLLAGIMAEEYIKAAQKIGAVCTIKHFVANNSDYDRHRCSSDIDERTLREIYLPAFERAVRRARVGAVMTAYNPVNGVYASAHKELITDILRGEWGFDGFVMSDWLSLYDTAGPIKAGLDLEMPKAKWLSPERVHVALEQGLITQEDLRGMVTRILATFFRLGVYDGPVQPEYNIPIGDPDHREIALQTAKEGIVLLKNGNSTSTQQDPMAPLPIEPKETGQSRLMLAGPFQNYLPRGGGGSSLVRTPINTQVFTAELSNDLGSSVEILSLSQPGAHLSSMGKGDTIMFLGGFDEDRQSEGYDRDWELPKKQQRQLARLRRLKRRQGFTLGVVLFSGGGVETQSWIADVDWLVWAGYPGQEGPEALSALLTCRENFCGKLPFTMIRQWEDLPANHFYVDDPGAVSLHRVFLDQGKITKRQPWSMQ
jgi:beta-glucosidase